MGFPVPIRTFNFRWRDIALLGVIAYLAAGQALPAVLALGPNTQAHRAPMANAFTYQGRLVDGGIPVDGSRNLQFKLWDSAADGSQLGSTLVANSLVVTNGLFSVQLDFGDHFDGERRWLEILVEGVGQGRTELTATPYALFASDAGMAASAQTAGSVMWSGVAAKPGGFGDDTDNDLLATLAPCSDGQVAKFNTGMWSCQPDVGAAQVTWASLTGKPAGFADDTDNDLLATLAPCSDGQVAKFNTGIWSCQPDIGAAQVTWASIMGKPAGFADDIDNDLLTTLSPCSDGQVPKYALGSWSCAPDEIATSVDWTNVINIPAGFADDIDNDLLASLAPCSNGQIPKYGTDTWSCQPDLTGPLEHFGESWSGSIARGGNLVPNAGLKVTNTFPAAGFSTPGGVGLLGSAATFGIGVYGIVTQPPGTSAAGVDLNTLHGGVVGYDRTLPCDSLCVGVKGISNSATGTGQSYGVVGSGSTTGVYGMSTNVGVKGESSNGTGVEGESSTGSGVFGSSTGAGAAGILGSNSTSSSGRGVIGQSVVSGLDGIGVLGFANQAPAAVPNTTGVYGYASSANSTGVYGRASGAAAAGVKGYAESADAYAGWFIQNVRIDGTLTVGGVIVPSDVRLKRDVVALSYGLDETLALRPVSYSMLDDASGRVRMGLVAQEVQESIPEAVVMDPNTEKLAVNYLELIPVLINAIQEQQIEIDSFRSAPGSGSSASSGGGWALAAVLAIPLLALAIPVVRRGRE